MTEAPARPLRRRRAVTFTPTGLAAQFLLVLLAALVLVPFVYLICSALKSPGDFFSSPFLPAGHGMFGVAWTKLTLSNLRRLFTEFPFPQYLLNSIFIASTTALLATICSAMGGYALAKFPFRGRSTVTTLALASLALPAALILAPQYALLYQLGLLDSYAGLILPAIAPPLGVYLFRQAFISGLPDELVEAARLDGCGHFRFFVSIALPAVRPMVGAFLMITFAATWNNFLSPQVILQSPEKFPLAVGIAQLKGIYSQDYGLLMAGTLVSIAPPALLFLLLQREFVTGMAGAIKG